jgi:hypothetical protein
LKQITSPSSASAQCQRSFGMKCEAVALDLRETTWARTMEMSTPKLPLRLYVIYLALLCICGLFHWNPVFFQQDWQTQFDIEEALWITAHTALESR